MDLLDSRYTGLSASWTNEFVKYSSSRNSGSRIAFRVQGQLLYQSVSLGNLLAKLCFFVFLIHVGLATGKHVVPVTGECVSQVIGGHVGRVTSEHVGQVIGEHAGEATVEPVGRVTSKHVG